MVWYGMVWCVYAHIYIYMSPRFEEKHTHRKRIENFYFFVYGVEAAAFDVITHILLYFIRAPDFIWDTRYV